MPFCRQRQFTVCLCFSKKQNVVVIDAIFFKNELFKLALCCCCILCQYVKRPMRTTNEAFIGN